ncbi:DNA-3-methyladenine glycosylase 2 family protein [Bacillus safensis]|uniref:DNA-3-methyladenine glycosylase family protein n=1 Tax=Bacillus TaxID=1386 RepID=UPI000DCDC918|nr:MULTISPECIES: DNA-3-methyladenine glycosylase [Bacillus]MBQ4842601.1 DNA-3-methyladenine glycosylase 2 family protein [Bacillus safensis]MBQ4873992.1 DNA-3-methyladenine glycosylase 2 family protein [Bacillus safensis]MBQ4887752.1 DNA-3-methyladenine glycosylase 2 family protein [Bacillus safensis]MBZ9521991.1 DNA-3-methyladenine glycosylase 2 family protein [Bacillus safensis]MED0801897.1 DNA-3-methyladenine glycosylase [Bacillus safensis]
MWEKQLAVEPPYHFDQVLRRLSSDPLKAVDLSQREIKVPIRLEQKPYVVIVQATGTKDAPMFRVRSNGPEEPLLSEVKRIFGMEHQLHMIQDHFSQTNLGSIFEQHIGTPLMLDFHLYHCLMKCIIHQQLNLSFAYELTKRFVHTYGEQIEGVWFDPLPETIASLETDDLRKLQFSQRKAEYVIDVSKRIVSGSLCLEELHDLSDLEVEERLLPIRGIGPWTVQNVLMNGLGRPNLFPVADIGIQNAIKRHFDLPEKPTKEEMAALSKEWTPYLSYASLYLWRSIETDK